MKLPSAFRRQAVVIALAAALGPAAVAGPVKPPAEPPAPAQTNAVEAIPRSVFDLPSPDHPVRDPFFPKSTRFDAVVPTTTNQTAVVVADLVLKGLAGRADAPLATINNVTFGVGEERDVRTTTGRVRVRCVAINLNDETVVVEVGGARRELRFSRRR